MSSETSLPNGIRPKLTVETAVSRFDILNGALIASITLFGFLASVLFLIWLTTVLEFKRESTVLAVYEQPYGDEKPEGYEDDILEPGVEEFPEVEEPVLKDALEAVTDAVSSVRASLEQVDGDSEVMGSGRGVGSLTGGDGTGGGDVVPEHNRWKFEYDAQNIDIYARQLSFFNIDIGAVSINAEDIIRIRDPGGSLTRIMSDRKTERKSVHFGHEKQRLQRWDARLAKKAGVDMSGKGSVQFFPEATRQLVRQAEGEYLRSIGRTLPEVGKTFIKIEAAGNGYQFKITNVQFRRR